MQLVPCLESLEKKNELGFLVAVILGGDSPTNWKDLQDPCLGKVIMTSCPRWWGYDRMTTSLGTFRLGFVLFVYAM
jgi:hypothetical protein